MGETVKIKWPRGRDREKEREGRGEEKRKRLERLYMYSRIMEKTVPKNMLCTAINDVQIVLLLDVMRSTIMTLLMLGRGVLKW